MVSIFPLLQAAAEAVPGGFNAQYSGAWAMLGAGIGAGIYANAKEASANRKPIGIVEPGQDDQYNDLYLQWEELLSRQLYNNKHATHSIML